MEAECSFGCTARLPFSLNIRLEPKWLDVRPLYFPNNRGWMFVQLHYYLPFTNFKSNDNNPIGAEIIGCSSFYFPSNGGWVFAQLHHYFPSANLNQTIKNRLEAKMIGCSSFCLSNNGGRVFARLHHYSPFINLNHTSTIIQMEPE